jgi:hypothetical protein
MRRVSFSTLVAVMLAIAIMPPARGQSPNTIGRYLGVGWSDGYHSHTACPPKPPIVHHRPAPVPVVTTMPPVAAAMPAPARPQIPWWKIPATPVEPAPAEPAASSAAQPAPPAQAGAADDSSAARSLFRQPGEGSSVTVADGPKL